MVLNGKLSLHDIEDVEAFCAYLINRQRRGGYTGHEYEELLTWFIESCWIHSVRFDPDRGSSFKHFIASKLRVASWERVRFGRTRWAFSTHVYERPRPVFVPIEDRPELADPFSAVHASADSLSDVLGIQREGGGQGAEHDGGGCADQDAAAA